MDVFPVETLVSDLYPSAEGLNCRKILNREPDWRRQWQNDD
jgi:hypothetical protein